MAVLDGVNVFVKVGVIVAALWVGVAVAGTGVGVIVAGGVTCSRSF